MAGQVELRQDTFSSDGLTLAGHVRVPDGPGPWPGLVFTGPFTGVKEQVTGTYAAGLAEAGFVTLAFDHRNFGGSEGEPRQHEDAEGKLADLRDAVSYLATLPEVDAARVGVVGVCLGTAYALKFSAFDPRVRSLALVAGAYNDPRDMRAGMGGEAYREQLARAAALAQREWEGGEVEYLPAVAPEGQPAVMGGQEPFDYYGTGRATSPGWRNQVTARSISTLITLDAAMAADFIAPTPTLVVHGRTDAFCSPVKAAEVYDRIGGPKDLYWLDTTNHIDLYDNPTFVAPALTRVADWFDTHLTG